MKDTDQSLLEYYATPDQITDLSAYRDQVAWLCDDVRMIFQVVQGLLIHDLWLQAYGICMRSEQTYGTKIAYMADLLEKATELDPRSLAIPRAPEQRVICCCREFATLFCAILRAKGIPARTRCGFARYLARPGMYEDHWVCQFFSAEQSRWVTVDPQIDPFQQSTIGIDFSPLDLPAGSFVCAGEAWRSSRSGATDATQYGIAVDPARFGLRSLYGQWFIRGQLLRDIAALNKQETVPFLVRLARGLTWDSWRLVAATDDELTQSDWELLDAAAEVSIDASSIQTIRSLYESNPDLRVSTQVLER